MLMYDFVVVGAGIIGTMIARELSRFEVKTLVIEKESDVANHQTIANSAIIHSGHDPEENSLKAKLCVLGNTLYDDLEHELNIPLLQTGALVIARTNEEVESLNMLYKRALKNGVKDVQILSKEELYKKETHLAEGILKALSLPTTKVTYPWEVAFAAMENAIMNGAKLSLNSEITKIEFVNHSYELTINHKRKIKTHAIINAAGVFADHVAKMIEPEVPYQITPRRGEYFVLDKKVKGFVQHVLYPIPSKKGKGVLLVPQVHGNILVGPTSELVDEKETLKTTKDGLNKIKEDASLLAKNIPFDQTIRTFAGIRATSTYKDFYIKHSSFAKNFFHVAGIDSPGLTAAPAIAKYVIDLIKNHIDLKPKEFFNPIRAKKSPFFTLDSNTQKMLFEKDKRYGRLICKCEKVTEMEIVEAIHGPLGNDTIKGLKKRIRAGSGLCQGGYCESEILKIIARETKKPLNKINYYHPNTPILKQETKVNK
jgi:glycerol-3-phosphate dehydrogenase